jgi:hypothetical protein
MESANLTTELLSAVAMAKNTDSRSNVEAATDNRDISAAFQDSRNRPELNAKKKRIHTDHTFADRVIDFFIIGAHKAGTTSLYDYLAQHPALFLPEIKETRFFNEPAIYQQGIRWLEPYYRSARNETLLGGADVHSMYFPISARNLYEHNPRMKLIAILRNPVDRAYSAYWWGRRNGFEHCRTFEEALALEERRARGSYTERSELTILSHGRYAEQLQRFYSLFGSSNVLVLLTEDLADNRLRDTLSRTMGWLGVDPCAAEINPNRRRNVSALPRSPVLQRILMSHDTWYRRLFRNAMPPSVRVKLQQFVVEPLKTRNVKDFKYPEMSARTRKELVNYFAPHNELLTQFIGRDLSHWGK